MMFTGEELIEAIRRLELSCTIQGITHDGEYATQLTLDYHNYKLKIDVAGMDYVLPKRSYRSFNLVPSVDQTFLWVVCGEYEQQICEFLELQKNQQSEQSNGSVGLRPDPDLRIISHNGRDYFFSELPYSDSLIQMPDGTIYKPVFPGGPGIKPTFQRIGKAVRAFAT